MAKFSLEDVCKLADQPLPRGGTTRANLANAIRRELPRREFRDEILDGAIGWYQSEGPKGLLVFRTNGAAYYWAKEGVRTVKNPEIFRTRTGCSGMGAGYDAAHGCGPMKRA